MKSTLFGLPARIDRYAIGKTFYVDFPTLYPKTFLLAKQQIKISPAPHQQSRGQSFSESVASDYLANQLT